MRIALPPSAARALADELLSAEIDFKTATGSPLDWKGDDTWVIIETTNKPAAASIVLVKLIKSREYLFDQNCFRVEEG